MEEYFMNKDHSDRFLLLANELKFANFEDSEWRTAIFLMVLLQSFSIKTF